MYEFVSKLRSFDAVELLEAKHALACSVFQGASFFSSVSNEYIFEHLMGLHKRQQL
jgi:hypothetical protein